jgi:hypothetical protein
MRSRRWVYGAVVVGLVVGMLTLLNRQSTGQARANKAAVVWEYKTFSWGGGDPTSSLNDLGKQGWELVTSRGYGNEPPSETLYVFKRAIP